MNDISKEIRKYMDNAKSRIKSAEVLHDTGQYNDAISRIYYAFFDAATAALLTKEITAKTHHGLVLLFEQHFIKSGAISSEIGKELARIKEEREEADYEVFREFTEEEVEKDLKAAKEFIQAVENSIIKNHEKK